MGWLIFLFPNISVGSCAVLLEISFRTKLGETNSSAVRLLNSRDGIPAPFFSHLIVLYNKNALIMLASRRKVKIDMGTRFSLLAILSEDLSWSKRSTPFMNFFIPLQLPELRRQLDASLL